jgi:hypothetical protein
VRSHPRPCWDDPGGPASRRAGSQLVFCQISPDTNGLKTILRAAPTPLSAILRCSTLTERPAMRGFRALAGRKIHPARSRGLGTKTMFGRLLNHQGLFTCSTFKTGQETCRPAGGCAAIFSEGDTRNRLRSGAYGTSSAEKSSGKRAPRSAGSECRIGVLRGGSDGRPCRSDPARTSTWPCSPFQSPPRKVDEVTV